MNLFRGEGGVLIFLIFILPEGTGYAVCVYAGAFWGGAGIFYYFLFPSSFLLIFSLYLVFKCTIPILTLFFISFYFFTFFLPFSMAY